MAQASRHGYTWNRTAHWQSRIHGAYLAHIVFVGTRQLARPHTQPPRLAVRDLKSHDLHQSGVEPFLEIRRA